MSELISARDDRNSVRRRLLATVSAATLLASIAAGRQANASDDDTARPPFWIELGGEFSHLEAPQDVYIPPSAAVTPPRPYAVIPLEELEKGPSSSWDGNAAITFEPTGTDWVFSAGIIYGKSNHDKSANQITPNLSAGRPSQYCVVCQGTQYNAYQIVAAKNSESHTILDFRAGKDIGLGIFGGGSRSVFSAGVRYAHFDSRSSDDIISKPTNIFFAYHRYYGNFSMERKFTGVGPSLAWDASANLMGEPSASHITVDWGVNGAVLFGRQRAGGHHQTTNVYQRVYYGQRYVTHQTHASPSRSKQVTVPNFGGFAGVSWRYPNAKVSVGYRADFFFGAMDGGIDAAKKENVGFYGPFATVSIGIGG